MAQQLARLGAGGKVGTNRGSHEEATAWRGTESLDSARNSSAPAQQRTKQGGGCWAVRRPARESTGSARGGHGSGLQIGSVGARASEPWPQPDLTVADGVTVGWTAGASDLGGQRRSAAGEAVKWRLRVAERALDRPIGNLEGRCDSGSSKGRPRGKNTAMMARAAAGFEGDGGARRRCSDQAVGKMGVGRGSGAAFPAGVVGDGGEGGFRFGMEEMERTVEGVGGVAVAWAAAPWLDLREMKGGRGLCDGKRVWARGVESQVKKKRRKRGKGKYNIGRDRSRIGREGNKNRENKKERRNSLRI